MKRWTWKHAVWILLYAGMITTIVVVLLGVRQQVQQDAQDPVAQQHWLDWVKTAQEQSSSDGPVQRRAPRSDAPPLTLLMDRYFVACLVASCLFATALFATLVFMIQGSYNTGTVAIEKTVQEADHER